MYNKFEVKNLEGRTKMKKRILSFAAAAALSLGLLGGCAEDAKPAITFRDTVITENEYCYYMSTYKGAFLAAMGQTTDNSAYWSSAIGEGVTVGDYVGVLATNEVMTYAVLLGLFDEYGLSLTTAEINSVDAAINQYTTAAGGKGALNSILSAYGINVGILREIKLDTLKIKKVQEYMMGEGDIIVSTDADREAYFEDAYKRVKYIFISSQKDYVRELDGSLAKNEDGSYKTRDITDTEKAEKAALVEELNDRLEAGEDFEALLSEYTMDVGMLHFPDGYYYTSSSSYVEAKVQTELTEAEIGEIVNIESDNGWYIAKPYELEDGAWKKEENAAMFTNFEAMVNTLKLQEYIGTFAEEVTLEEGVVASYPIAYCSPNFSY